MSAPRGRHADALAAASLALLPAALLGRALVPGRALSPADILLSASPWRALAPDATAQNPLLGDVAFMFHPWLLHAAAEVRGGTFPLWNPHAFTGAPFFANPQTALLFPLTWVAWVLSAAPALAVVAILKLALGGVGTYALLRLLSAGTLPAWAGAAAYMLSAPMVVWLGWSFGTAMAMLPWLFAAVERLRVRPDARSVALLAIATALLLLAGYPQGAFHALVAGAAYAATRAASADAPAAFLARAAAGAVLGLALAAPQVLAFLEYSSASSVWAYRSAGGMPVSTLPPATAVTLALPLYYGTPLGHDFRGPLNFNEIATSVGIVPWLALPVALVCGWRLAATRFFAVVGAVAGALVYGLPGLTPIVARVPPFSFAANHRLLPLAVLALAVLCGLGLSAIAGAGAAGRRRAAIAVKVVACAAASALVLRLAADQPRLARLGREVDAALEYGLALALLTLAATLLLGLLRGDPRPERRLSALAALAVAALAPLAAVYNPVIDVERLYPPAPALDAITARSRLSHGRALLPGSVNMGMLYGFDEVAGYDGMTPRLVEQVAGPGSVGHHLGNGGLSVTRALDSPVFDLLGLRYLLTGPGIPAPAPHFTLAYDGRDGRVWENPRALPRAFLVGRVRSCVGDAAALELLAAGGLDVGGEVVIDACGDVPAVAEPRERGATVRAHETHRVRIETTADTPVFLVLTDTWYPGWHASVDGQPARVWRADHAFRAVWLPPGRHEVEFRYRPRSVLVGAVIAVGAAVCVLVLAVRRARRDDAAP
jgi:hypothetical protein